MNQKIFHVMYDDDQVLLAAAKDMVAQGVRVNDVYSPFPIHGLDPVIGVKKTRLAMAAFLYGITGTLLALFGINYFNIMDWPMNIGGKPSFSLIDNLPAFIPITFEFTVLCAAHGMALTYLFANWTFPGIKARNPDPRTTDDKFVMEIVSGANGRFSEEQLLQIINGTPVYELSIKETEHV